MASLAIGAIAGAISGSIAQEFSKDTVNKVIKDSQTVISHTVSEALIDIHNHEEDIKRLNYTTGVLLKEIQEAFAEARKKHVQDLNVANEKYRKAEIKIAQPNVICGINKTRDTRVLRRPKDFKGTPKNSKISHGALNNL